MVHDGDDNDDVETYKEGKGDEKKGKNMMLMVMMTAVIMTVENVSR